MEAHLYLEARLGMIGSATDFVYKWCINMKLDSGNAARMALAVDEILTAIILHAYKPKTFFEVLHILGLHQTWDLKSIIEP